MGRRCGLLNVGGRCGVRGSTGLDVLEIRVPHAAGGVDREAEQVQRRLDATERGQAEEEASTHDLHTAKRDESEERLRDRLELARDCSKEVSENGDECSARHAALPHTHTPTRGSGRRGVPVSVTGLLSVVHRNIE